MTSLSYLLHKKHLWIQPYYAQIHFETEFQYFSIEIKTFGLALEFEISFQQQQHSVAFMLLYSDLRGCWDVFFFT